MGSRRQTGLVIVIVLILTVTAILAPSGDGRDSRDPRASSFHVSPDGTRALYHALEELGITVERRLISLRDSPPRSNALAMLAPTRQLTLFEIDELLGWVEDGGTLLYAAGRAGPDPLLDELGVVLGWSSATGEEETIRAAEAEPHEWAAGADPLPGVWRIFADTSEALVSGAAEPVLRTVSGEAVVLEIPLEEGLVVAWSDARPLRNHTIREAKGGAVVFARAAADATAGGGALAFDEYFHGYREGAGPFAATMRFFRERPEGRASLQLGIVALGLLFLLGRRFGAPLPMPAPLRRSPLEHVEALASAYQQGGARTTAQRLVLAGLARRLGRTAPQPRGEVAWLERLAGSLVNAHDEVHALRAEWERGRRADLVALTAAADAVAGAAQHRPRPRDGRRRQPVRHAPHPF